MSDTISQAKEALDLALAVIGAGSVTFVATSWRLCSEEEKLDRGRALLAVLLASVGLVLASVAVVFMAPITWESVGENRGEVSGVLFGYDLISALAGILLLIALATFVRAIRYTVQTFRAYRD